MVHASTTPISNWTVSWTWPGAQSLTQAWSGTSSSTGSLVSVKNAAWNGTVAANSHTTFGRQRRSADDGGQPHLHHLLILIR
jgi:chitin-binding protein